MRRFVHCRGSSSDTRILDHTSSIHSPPLAHLTATVRHNHGIQTGRSKPTTNRPTASGNHSLLIFQRVVYPSAVLSISHLMTLSRRPGPPDKVVSTQPLSAPRLMKSLMLSARPSSCAQQQQQHSVHTHVRVQSKRLCICLTQQLHATAATTSCVHTRVCIYRGVLHQGESRDSIPRRTAASVPAVKCSAALIEHQNLSLQACSCIEYVVML